MINTKYNRTVFYSQLNEWLKANMENGDRYVVIEVDYATLNILRHEDNTIDGYAEDPSYDAFLVTNYIEEEDYDKLNEIDRWYDNRGYIANYFGENYIDYLNGDW